MTGSSELTDLGFRLLFSPPGKHLAAAWTGSFSVN